MKNKKKNFGFGKFKWEKMDGIHFFTKEWFVVQFSIGVVMAVGFIIMYYISGGS